MNNEINICWYGRCCFLVTLDNKRILFDPYDRFCKVDMGLVEAEMILSSSTWHDHGNIGASPGAWVFSYPEAYEHLGFKITGIETKEARGTPNTVFNVLYKNVSITNFADMGNYDETDFNNEQKEILKSTNIAFVRSGHENVLDFCKPRIVIPEHYFPNAFIESQIPENLKDKFREQDVAIDEMVKTLHYPLREIDGYRYNFFLEDITENTLFRFLKVHPQVKYSEKPEFKKYW